MTSCDLLDNKGSTPAQPTGTVNSPAHDGGSMAPGSQPMLAASVRKLFDQVPASTLALWCENKECAIDFEETLTGGLTKAKLAVVSVQDRNGSRTAVLKHCPAHPPREAPHLHTER